IKPFVFPFRHTGCAERKIKPVCFPIPADWVSWRENTACLFSHSVIPSSLKGKCSLFVFSFRQAERINRKIIPASSHSSRMNALTREQNSYSSNQPGERGGKEKIPATV